MKAAFTRKDENGHGCSRVAEVGRPIMAAAAYKAATEHSSAKPDTG
jgi:coenzyme F420-reducing hydrogenase beta subunit